MFFCPNCNYTFDITKTTQQIGKGKASTQVTQDLSKITPEQTPLASPTNNTNQGEQATNINKNMAYFSCNNCGNVEKIEPGTRIYTKTSYDVSQNYTSSNMKLMIHSTILPYTKNYNCVNKHVNAQF